MKVLHVCVLGAACCDAKCSILDSLEFVHVCVGDDWSSDCACVFKVWFRDGIVGSKDCFFLFSPVF